MAKSVKVIIAETEYTVPQMLIGQLERVTDLSTTGAASGRFGFGVLRIALERAEPKVADLGQLPATMEEIGTAVHAVLEMSGLAQKEPTAGEAPATPAGAS